MSDFGLFEADEVAQNEPRRQARTAARQLEAAIDVVRSQFGRFLMGATGIDEFGDRWHLSKHDIRVAVEPYVFPATGTMRRIQNAMKQDWKLSHPYKVALSHDEAGFGSMPEGDGPPKNQDLDETYHPSSGNLDPSPDWEGYKSRVDQDGPEKVQANDFTPGGDSGSDRREAARLVADIYTDFARSNGLRVASLDTLDLYASTGIHDADYRLLQSMIIRQAECDEDCDDEDDSDDESEDGDSGSESEAPEGDSDDSDSEDDAEGDDEAPDFGGDDAAEDFGDSGEDEDFGGEDAGGETFTVPEQAPELSPELMAEIPQDDAGGSAPVPPEVIDSLLGLPEGTIEQLLLEEVEQGGDSGMSGGLMPQGGGDDFFGGGGDDEQGPPPRVGRRRRADAYHITNLGDLAGDRTNPDDPAYYADKDGFVPQPGDRHEDFTHPAGGAYDPEYVDSRDGGSNWDDWVSDAQRATDRAERRNAARQFWAAPDETEEAIRARHEKEYQDSLRDRFNRPTPLDENNLWGQPTAVGRNPMDGWWTASRQFWAGEDDEQSDSSGGGQQAAPAQDPAAPQGGMAGGIDPNAMGGGQMMPPPGSQAVQPPQPPAPLENQPAEDALLDTANQAIMQMIDRETQEYQQIIDPLSQALQAIQFAQQVEQSEHPMDVTPPQGTVDVSPSAAPGGQAPQQPMQQQAMRRQAKVETALRNAAALIASRYRLSATGHQMLVEATLGRRGYEHVVEALRLVPPESRKAPAIHMAHLFAAGNQRFNKEVFLRTVMAGTASRGRLPFDLPRRSAGETWTNTSTMDAFEFPNAGEVTEVTDAMTVNDLPKMNGGHVSNLRGGASQRAVDRFQRWQKRQQQMGLPTTQGEAAIHNFLQTSKPYKKRVGDEAAGMIHREQGLQPDAPKLPKAKPLKAVNPVLEKAKPKSAPAPAAPKAARLAGSFFLDGPNDDDPADDPSSLHCSRCGHTAPGASDDDDVMCPKCPGAVMDYQFYGHDTTRLVSDFLENPDSDYGDALFEELKHRSSQGDRNAADLVENNPRQGEAEPDAFDVLRHPSSQGKGTGEAHGGRPIPGEDYELPFDADPRLNRGLLSRRRGTLTRMGKGEGPHTVHIDRHLIDDDYFDSLEHDEFLEPEQVIEHHPSRDAAMRRLQDIADSWGTQMTPYSDGIGDQEGLERFLLEGPEEGESQGVVGIRRRDVPGADYQIPADEHPLVNRTLQSNRQASFFTRRVPGWRWDDHLNGYISKEGRAFTCSCGQKVAAPSYKTCSCGKIWNVYAIGDTHHLASDSAEMFIAREIPVRPGVVMANRKMAGGLSQYQVTTPSGTRIWHAESPEHAAEQHSSAFEGDPDEEILDIQRGGPSSHDDTPVPGKRIKQPSSRPKNREGNVVASAQKSHRELLAEIERLADWTKYDDPEDPVVKTYGKPKPPSTRIPAQPQDWASREFTGPNKGQWREPEGTALPRTKRRKK